VLLVFFMLPNFVGPLGPPGHLWTIGLEEQFYLCWPWVLKRPQRLLPVVFGIIVIKLAVAPVIAAFNSDAMMNLLLGLRFECMAIGAVAAYLYFCNHRFLRLIYSLPAQIVTLGSFVYLMLNDIPVTAVGNVVISMIFSALMLNIATNEHSLLKLNAPWFNRLGQISYGIYMIHFPLLYTVIFLLLEAGVPEGEMFDLILYTTVIGGTLVLAVLSYNWFEMPFLNRKKRFAIVPTHAQAHP
jgi:peptidoglycan/LPS O-acetylase OafA/YrhL